MNKNSISQKEIYTNRIVSSKEFIKQFTPEVWLIDDILPSIEFGEIFGASGSRKTFIALDMGTCIHNGLSWHGHDTAKGNVLYVCGEAQNGVRKRLGAFAKHYHVEECMHILPTSIDMMLEDSLQQLAKDIEAFDGNYSFIIIDTLNANFTGSEDDAGDFALMKANLQKYLGRTSRLIMWIHHTGNSEGDRGRGSSARFAGIDVSIQVKKSEKFSTLINRKQKEADMFKNLSFSFEHVDTGFCEENGTPLFSLVPLINTGVIANTVHIPKYNEEICKGIRLAIKENKTVEAPKEFEKMFNLRHGENRCIKLQIAKEYAYKMFDHKNKTQAFNRWLESARKANICYFYDDFILLANDAKLTYPTKNTT
jgi:putative DNA primase/helicase